MAITDPQAVRFCNETIRQAADKIVGLHYELIRMKQQWVAEGMGAKQPDDGQVVEDGAPADGRPPLNTTEVNALKDYVLAFTADMEANDNLKLNTALGIAVNPR